MRVILDTNVLLAALISTRGPPDLIYRAWRTGRFELITSTQQIDELRRASRYPKLRSILPAHRVGTMINNLQNAVVLARLPPPPEGVEADDPDDLYLLTMAVAGAADYLVTGHRRAGLLRRGSIGRARILTPADFSADVL